MKLADVLKKETISCLSDKEVQELEDALAETERKRVTIDQLIETYIAEESYALGPMSRERILQLINKVNAL